MAHNFVSVTRSTNTNHESSPLTHQRTSESRGSSIPERATSTTRYPLRISYWSGRTLKISSIFLLVSWATIVLSFRYKTTRTPFPSSCLISSTFGAGVASDSTGFAKKQQTKLRGNTNTDSSTQDNYPMKVSLWLVPPGQNQETGNNSQDDSILSRTQKVIDDLSTELNGPKFLPHVTIVGGIPVDSEADALALAENLRNGLKGFGQVECSFGDTVLSAQDCWNQALILELVPPSEDADFLNLCRACRKIMGMEQTDENGDACLTFPAPLKVPHMSLYYGSTPPEPTETYISRVFGDDHQKSFRAHRVMLWKTYPLTAEGVPEWQPLADFSIL